MQVLFRDSTGLLGSCRDDIPLLESQKHKRMDNDLESLIPGLGCKVCGAWYLENGKSLRLLGLR